LRSLKDSPKGTFFVMPGKVFELPEWFRKSLTANDEMVERALQGFERALNATLTAPV